MAIDRKELLFGVGLAFTWFVLVKLADWLVAGFALNTFGPHAGNLIHLALFALVLLAFVGRGVVRLRDRFSLLVGAAVLALPLAVYVVTAW